MEFTLRGGKLQRQNCNRGTVRIDIGMLGEWNPEVIDDNISKVGRNGVVLIQKLSPNSNAWANGERQQVKMLQIR